MLRQILIILIELRDHPTSRKFVLVKREYLAAFRLRHSDKRKRRRKKVVEKEEEECLFAIQKQHTIIDNSTPTL